VIEAGGAVSDGTFASTTSAEAAAGPITTVVDLIEAGHVDLVINIPRGRGARSDGYEIRRAALRRGVPTMTNAAAAHAAVQAIASARRNREVTVACLQDLHHRLAASAASGSGAGGAELRREAADHSRQSAGKLPSGAGSAPGVPGPHGSSGS